ncbi:hypothetical protein SAY86_003422 [Trapa natans]|uniref:Uncharacterized protein n=1 Tax=Trapa natans TaxID=22666 RepID=A0AAN7MWN0_TRANT|nr:hypothetical protein SAY86_003422 [Trapa natans]
MAKAASKLVSSLVRVASIRTATSADDPTEAVGWSPLADRVGGVSNSNGGEDKGSPTAAEDHVSSQAAQVMEDSKKETVTWTDWLKDKLGAKNIFGGSSDHSDDDEAAAAAPSA